MDVPEIEYLITQAINDRPKVTTAPMNLYIYKDKIVCGARIVMPSEASFVAHVPPAQLKNGFSTKEWKLIVEKVINIQNPPQPEVKAPKKITKEEKRRSQLQELQQQVHQEKINELCKSISLIEVSEPITK